MITDEQRCVTCRFWDAFREGRRGWCTIVKAYPWDEVSEAPAIITYEIGDAIHLETGFDFGCVQWQAKDQR